jgi:hypothetical protein
MDPIDLDAYEAQREGSRRDLRQMMMNYFQRRTLLSYRYGITEKELDEAARVADKIRQQRSVTRALLPTFLLEDLVMSAARKTKRALGSKQPSFRQDSDKSIIDKNVGCSSSTPPVPQEQAQPQQQPCCAAANMPPPSQYDEDSEALYI